MDLDAAITRALELRGTQAVYGEAPALVTVLAEDTSGRGLPALLAMFVQAQSSSGGPAKQGLIQTAAPEASRAVADQLEGWFAAGHTSAASHGCHVLARRGDPRAVPSVCALAAVASAADDRVVLDATLIARMALGDATATAAWTARIGVPTQGDGFEHVARKLLEVCTPARYFELTHPYVEQAQAGDDGWLHAAGQVLQVLLPSRKKVQVSSAWIDPPAPPVDPRWFELGVRLYVEHAASMLQRFVPPLLTVDHPDRPARLQALVTTTPNVPLVVCQHARAGHPLLEDAAFCDQHALYETLIPREGGWELRAKTSTHAEIEAILDRLGVRATEVTCLSFAGRTLDDQAFATLAEFSTLARFRALDLSWTGITSKGLAAFSKSPHLATLAELGLRGHRLSKATLTSLARLPALVALQLAADDRARQGTKELELLCASKLAPRLRALSLEQWKLDGDLATLAQAFGGGALRELRLRGSIPLASLPTLLSLAHQHGVPLEASLVHDPRYTGAALDWNVPWPATLRELTIAPATNDVFRALVRGDGFAQLASVSVAGTSNLTDDGLDVLDDLEGVALRRLDLRDDPGITGAGLRRIAASPIAAQLEWLGIGGATNVRQADVDALPVALRAAVVAAGWPS